jgi:hypothetical protein
MFFDPEVFEILRPFTFTDAVMGSCRELTRMAEDLGADADEALSDAIVNGAAAVICPDDVCPA